MTDVSSPADTGAQIMVPLNKLKKSPSNARKVPHGKDAIEALAASINTKGLIQNLVIEPEVKDGEPTGCYLVTAGEGRRLALLLCARRKQIKRTHPVRCWLDTANDPGEISLDENVTRTAMHPADQFERFRELAERKGWGAEEIAARFGVTAHIVRQRLRLAAVSPKLIEVYRADGLTLDHLMAFAITDDHARQEQVFANLHYNREPWIIRRDLTADNVPAVDRRAIFVGADAYVDAGGVIIRDLFTDDRGGFFADAGLLDMLVMEKLHEVAGEVAAEGWKWTEIHIDYPHGSGFRRTYPTATPLSAEDDAQYKTLAAEYDQLTEGYEDFDSLPEDIVQAVLPLEAQLNALTARRLQYDPDTIARGGVFVVLGPDGKPRSERGFIRPEDEVAAEPADDSSDAANHPIVRNDATADDEADGAAKPLSEALVRDLTAHRTLGLRLALGDRSDVALIALTHALVAQTFYRTEASCLEIRPTSTALGTHADGIEDSAAGVAMAEWHERWASDLPRDVADLWAWIVALDTATREALLAYTVALTVNVIRLPWDRKPGALEVADQIAEMIGFDMTAYWTPTTRSYFGRVTKAQISDAVREGVSAEAADRIEAMKKPDMAAAAEELLSGSRWLPALLRAPKREGREEAEVEVQEAYDVAAE